MNSRKTIASPLRAMSRSILSVCLGLALACAGTVAGATNKHAVGQHHKAHSTSKTKAKVKNKANAKAKATPVVRQVQSVPASEATAASNERLVSEFGPLIGSREEAESLVATMRSGRATSTSGPASLAPATGPLGYGEVRLALKLAQGALKQQGVTAPTQDQLSAALHGGRVQTPQGEQALVGVLPQRQLGAGWAALAEEYGLSAEDMMPPPRVAAHHSASAAGSPKAKAHGKHAKGAKTAKARGKASAKSAAPRKKHK
jgi:hypothetical protein